MKKLISFALALVFILSLSTVALADEIWPKPNQDAKFYKEYIVWNNGTTAPAATFTFEFEADSVVSYEENKTLTVADMPHIDDATVEYKDGMTFGNPDTQKEVPVVLTGKQWPGIGEYYYTVFEVDGKIAGIDYSKKVGTMKVTVAYNEENGTYYTAFITMSLKDENPADGQTDSKFAQFVNVYYAGELQVSKTVTGNMGDKTKYFKVIVTLNGETGKTYADSFEVTGGTKIEDGETDCAESTITVDTPKEFWLKHGETISIKNLPYGMTYTVEEADYTTEAGGKYNDPVYTLSDSAKTIDSELDKVGIENKKESTVDTGIVLDSMPYVLLLAVAIFGMAMMSKKRRYEN